MTQQYPDDSNYIEFVASSVETRMRGVDDPLTLVHYTDEQGEGQALVIDPCTEEVLPKNVSVDDKFRIYFTDQVAPGGLKLRTVRGMYHNGVKVFYRTSDLDESYNKRQLYGKTPAEWLRRHDDGEFVYVAQFVDMRHLSLNHEMAMHVLFVDLLRFMLDWRAKNTDVDLLNEDGERAVFEALDGVCRGTPALQYWRENHPSDLMLVMSHVGYMLAYGPNEYIKRAKQSPVIRFRRYDNYAALTYVSNPVAADGAADSASGD